GMRESWFVSWTATDSFSRRMTEMLRSTLATSTIGLLSLPRSVRSATREPNACKSRQTSSDTERLSSPLGLSREGGSCGESTSFPGSVESRPSPQPLITKGISRLGWQHLDKLDGLPDPGVAETAAED